MAMQLRKSDRPYYEAKAAADSIHGSVKALMRDDVSIESAIDFYSEMLGCTPDELGG